MRIALVGPVFPYKGGISQFTSLLADRLHDDDEVLVVSWKRQYPARLYPGASQTTPDAPALATPARFVLDYRNPLSWLRAALLIRRWRAEWLLLAWATTFSAFAYLVLIAVLRIPPRSTRLAAICHNVVPHERRPFDRLLTAAVLRRVDAAVVHAEPEQTKLAEIAPATRSTALFLPPLAAIPDDGSDLAPSGLTRPLRERVALFFGHVRPYKGLRYLVEAWPAVVAETDADLVIVGEFWEPLARYREAIDAAGVADHVQIVDRYVPEREMRGYFRAADVVVLPYADATQSGVVPVAFAMGVPVISTTVGGVPEVVRDGDNGLLVPPRDTDALAKAIVRYFRDGLGPAMRAQVARDRERFSWPRYVSELREFLTTTT